MSVCDPVTGMHQIYSGLLPQAYFAEAPQIAYHDSWDEDDIISFETLIEAHHKELCGVILEPIVQGAGGMRFYHRSISETGYGIYCSHYNVLLIADEIATGFGRSGRLFACDHAGNCPGYYLPW